MANLAQQAVKLVIEVFTVVLLNCLNFKSITFPFFK